MKNTRKLLSVLLAAVMILTAFPLGAFEAFAVDNTVQTSTDGLWKYKFLTEDTVTIASGSNDKAYLGDETEVYIPYDIDGYTVTEIGLRAFNGCSFIEKVEMPEGVTSVKNYAFMGCSALEEVVFSENLTAVSFGSFLNCSQLKRISFPKTLVSIGSNAFKGCAALTTVTIPASVTTLGGSAFANCTSLESVAIPSGIANIDATVFSGCTALTTVYGYAGSAAQSFATTNGYTFVDLNSNAVFDYNILNDEAVEISGIALGSAANLVIPEKIEGYPVKQIADEAFKNNTDIVTVEFPRCIERIGYCAFSGCTSLTQAKIPSVNAYIDYYGLGYSDSDNGIKVNGFTILCPVNSEAYNYAVDNGFDYEFLPLSDYLDYEEIDFGETLSVEVTSQERIKYVKFVPDKSGTFYVIASNGDGIDPYGYLYDSTLEEIAFDDDSAGNRYFEISYSFTANETYFIGCSAYGSGTSCYDITVLDSKPVTSIYLSGDSTVRGLAGTQKDLDVYYEPYNATEPTYTWTSSNTSVATVDANGKVSFISAGTATITVTANGDSNLTDSCTVVCAVASPIQLDTPVTVNITNPGDYKYFSFTPSESGTYSFSASSEEYINTYGYLYDSDLYQIMSDGYSGENDHFKITYELEAGDTYIFAARMNYSDETGSFDVLLKKVPAATGISFVQGSSYTGRKYNEKEFNIVFAPEECVKEYCTFSIDNEDVAEITYSYSYSCEVQFLSEGTATLTATSANGLTATCTITVTAPNAMTLGTPCTVNMTDGQDTTVTFTPSESGTYYFDFSDYSNGSNFRKDLYREFSYYTYTYNNRISYDLSAGNTYVLHFYDYTGVFKATVSKAVPATGIEFTEPAGYSDYPGTWKTLYVKTLPDNAISEEITFASSDNSIVSVDYTGSEYSTGYYYCELNLNAAGTATITATSENGLTAQYVVTVKSYPQLTLGVPYEIEANDEQDVVAFTPSESGYYLFEFSDYSGDDWFEKSLYEGNNSYSSYSTYDDTIKYELQAGTTYRFKADYSGSFKVTVTKMSPATSLVFTTEPGLTGYRFDSIYLNVKLLPENSIPEDIVFTSSDSNIVRVENTYSDECYLVLNSAGTATITARSTNGLTATYTVVVKSTPTLTLGVASRVTVTNNEEQVYMFTPSESGTYIFVASNYSNSNEAWMNLKKGGNYYNEFSSYSNRMSCELEANVTYVLSTAYHSYSSPGSGSFDLTVNKAVPATSISFEQPNGYTGYEYSETYLRINLLPVFALEESVRFTSSNSNIVKVTGGSNEECEIQLLAPGTANITATSENGLNATVPVTVQALPQMQLDTPYIVRTNDYNDESLVAFKPSQSGGYYFSTTNGRMRLYDGFDYLTYSYGNIYRELTAGKTYIINLSELTDSNTARLVVTKAVPATGISFGSGNLIVDPYTTESLYCSFEPANAIKEPITFTSSDSSIAEITYSGETYCNLKLLKPGTATITARSRSGLTATKTVTVNAIPELELDTPSTVIANSWSKKVSFTPETDGDYVFMLSDIRNTNVSSLSINEGFDYITGKNYPSKLSYHLEAGKTYIIEVNFDSYSSNSSSLSANITVANAVPATSIVFTTEPGYENYAYTGVGLNVTSLPENAADVECTFTSSNENIVSLESDPESSVYATLLAPGTATVTATSANGLTATYLITVKPTPVLTLNTPYEVTVTDNKTEHLSFTPGESGEYVFRCSDYSNNNKAGLYLYEGFSCIEDYDSGTGLLKYYLEANTTYTIRTSYYSYSGKGNGTYNVTVAKAVPATSMSFAQSALTGYVGTTAYLPSVSFEPWNSISESYTFSSLNPRIVTVDDKGNLSFVAAGTATVTATSENGLTATCTVTVKNMKTITLGVETTAEITTGGGYDYFKFTPSETGYYAFYSSADDDTYGYLYDNDFNELARNDDSGSGSNFRIRYELQAGVTYIFGARYYDSEDIGSFPVKLEKKACVTKLEIVSQPTKTECIKGFVSETFNPSGLRIKLTWSDGRTTYYNYNPDNRSIDGLYVDVSTFTYNNGNNAYYEVRYDGNTDSGELTVIENPVASIELAYVNDIVLVENLNGYETTSYQNGQSVTYFRYNYDAYSMSVKINYKDGSSRIAEIGSSVDGLYIRADDTQGYDNRWTVGSNNFFTISYAGKTVNVPVLIIPNDVVSLEVVTPPAVQLIENADGFEDTRWDEATQTNLPYFHYWLGDEDLTDTVIRINYRDGSSKTAHFGDMIDGYELYWNNKQYNNPWSVGTNYITAKYKGVSVQVPIQVIQTPVSRIVINTAPSAEYVYGDIDYGYFSHELNDTQYYCLQPEIVDGLAFTVYYKNGTNKRFTSADIAEDGTIDGHTFRLSASNPNLNNENRFTGPGNATVNFEYMGVKATYTATLKASPVRSIQIVQQPAVANRNEYFGIDPNGMKVKINYTNGTSKTVTFTDSAVTYEIVGNWTKCSMDVDGHPMWFDIYFDNTVYYLGASAEINATTTRLEPTDIAVSTFSPNADGMVLDVVWADGTSQSITLSALYEIEPPFAAAADDEWHAYITRTPYGLLWVEMEPIYDSNRQLQGYYIWALGRENYYSAASGDIQGDVDKDGEVDIADYAMLKQHLSGRDIAQTRLDAGDINNDGTVDAFDLFYLDKLINNLVASKFTTSVLNATSAKITAYSGTDTNLTIPDSINGYKITAIDTRSFQGKTTLRTVTMPDGVTSIGNYAFMNCTSLETVYLPYGITTIPYGCFNGCQKLKNVRMPNSVTSVGSYAFKDCKALENIAISNKATAINANAFANCTSLKVIIIPESVTTINANAFTGCSSALTIYGKTGSYAQTYANTNGYTFVAIG